ncbi:EAL domain-containing protein [Caballeronia arvi]|uniref:EAL domain-containing protein n=1 Tax=Caballeronia arvi TaxID=1777135 RepID=UPI000772CF46|nr:EAL domain-containing protein [Caballeronia arvi]
MKSPRSSVAGDWPWVLAAWLSIGVVAGGAFGWLAYKRITRQLSFPSTLEWAISRRKIDVVYQPIVRLADDACIGVEARVRWTLHGRPVSPEVFVRVAASIKETGIASGQVSCTIVSTNDLPIFSPSTSNASSVVAPHIIAMAHELGVEIVAEGVETGAQAAWLIKRGVQYAQGWFYAKAMPASELFVWLEKSRVARGR